METRENIQQQEENNGRQPPYFTGWFSGEISIISCSWLIAILLLDKALEPPRKVYSQLKNKIKPKAPPPFPEQELNDWYYYYKQYGEYPAYLQHKYADKYPNLDEIFNSKSPRKLIKQNNARIESVPGGFSRSTNTLFANRTTNDRRVNENKDKQEQKLRLGC